MNDGHEKGYGNGGGGSGGKGGIGGGICFAAGGLLCVSLAFSFPPPCVRGL